MHARWAGEESRERSHCISLIRSCSIGCTCIKGLKRILATTSVPSMTPKLLTGLVTVMLLLLTSCATVKLSGDGTKARVLGMDEVKKCQNTGSVTVSVNQKTLNVIPKRSSSVASQLQILARNSAVHMGGDTVVPVSNPEYGQQTFAVFRCIP